MRSLLGRVIQMPIHSCEETVMKSVLMSLSVCLVAVPLTAGEVTIAKSHICCGGCAKAIEKTLAAVEGVSEVSVSQDDKSISFQTTDAKIARQAVQKLGQAGFAGDAKHAGKAVKLRAPKVEQGTKADTVTFNRMHLCCGACVKAVEGAVSKVEGVESVTCDRDKGRCTATGKDVDVLAVLKSLRDAGFNGTIPAKKGKKAKKKDAES